MISSPETTTPIEPLRRLLAKVRREARTWVWVESLAALAVAAAVIFWATLATDSSHADGRTKTPTGTTSGIRKVAVLFCNGRAKVAQVRSGGGIK